MKDRFYYALEKARNLAKTRNKELPRFFSFVCEDDPNEKTMLKIYREYCYDIIKDELIK